jgi:hypothetical protein
MHPGLPLQARASSSFGLLTVCRSSQNPFPYLVRDADVEGMSDGFDNATAYGANTFVPL